MIHQHDAAWKCTECGAASTASAQQREDDLGVGCTACGALHVWRKGQLRLRDPLAVADLLALRAGRRLGWSPGRLAARAPRHDTLRVGHAAVASEPEPPVEVRGSGQDPEAHVVSWAPPPRRRHTRRWRRDASSCLVAAAMGALLAHAGVSTERARWAASARGESRSAERPALFEPRPSAQIAPERSVAKPPPPSARGESLAMDSHPSVDADLAADPLAVPPPAPSGGGELAELQPASPAGAVGLAPAGAVEDRVPAESPYAELDAPRGEPGERPPATAPPAGPPANLEDAMVEAVGLRAPPAAVAAVQPPPPRPVPVRFDTAAASSSLRRIAGGLGSCRKDDAEAGLAGRVRVVFLPSGAASTATVVGAPFAGTPTGSCIASMFRSARVPAFEGEPTAVTLPFVMR